MKHSEPKIINQYSAAPRGIEWQVRRSLRWFDPSLLRELGSIIIECELPDAPHGDYEPEFAEHVRALGQAGIVMGWYAPVSKRTPAFITLYASPIYRPIPSYLWWTPVVTLRILRTLAHEVAHHLVATRGYIFEQGEDLADEEALANRFSATVLKAAAGKWSYRLGQKGMKLLASRYHLFALIDWEKEDFSAAATRFYNAWDLCPDSEEAAYWYWQARDKLDGPAL